MPREYSANKEYYNKNQKEIEYGKSKTFYPNDRISSEEEKLELKKKVLEFRKSNIETIISAPARMFQNDFHYFITNPSLDVFEWNVEALEKDDDVSLIFKATIVKKRMENNLKS